MTYQPASRYWPFQAYETAIFAGLAALLILFCLWWIRRPTRYAHVKYLALAYSRALTGTRHPKETARTLLPRQPPITPSSARPAAQAP